MKKSIPVLFALALFFSCTDTGHPTVGPPQIKGLVPYAQRFKDGLAKDTLLPGNVYLHYFVSTDTSDAGLYIRYGRPGFDSVYKETDGTPFNCSSWEYTYHTAGVIGMMYECPAGRQLLLLPLNATDSIRMYDPLFVGVEDSLLLVEGNAWGAGDRPVLVAADLGFKRQKSFQLSYDLPSANLLACFDTIYFRHRLVLQYESGEAGSGLVTRTQEETLDWKK